MRAALHLLGTIVLVPYLLLAGMFLLLGHALAGGTLASLFQALLDEALWLLPWGGLAFCAGVLALAALGCVSRWQHFASACLAVLAAGCIVVIVMMPATTPDAGQWLFLAPCFAIALLASVMAVHGLHAQAGVAAAGGVPPV